MKKLFDDVTEARMRRDDRKLRKMALELGTTPKELLRRAIKTLSKKHRSKMQGSSKNDNEPPTL